MVVVIVHKINKQSSDELSIYKYHLYMYFCIFISKFSFYTDTGKKKTLLM